MDRPFGIPKASPSKDDLFRASGGQFRGFSKIIGFFRDEKLDFCINVS